jgi:ABC-type dipeptide/oligopeptide/nickel transport system permease subunit
MALNIPQASEEAHAGSAPEPGADLAVVAKKIEGRSPWRLAMQRLLHDKASMISLSVIVFIILVAIFAPVVAAIVGHGPNQQFYAPIGLNANGQPLGPSSHFLLGTDTLGRDILVRIAYGTRVSLIVGVLASVISVATGAIVGLAAGYFGGITDTLLARLMDWLLAIPFLLLAISLVTVIWPSPWSR